MFSLERQVKSFAVCLLYKRKTEKREKERGRERERFKNRTRRPSVERARTAGVKEPTLQCIHVGYTSVKAGHYLYLNLQGKVGRAF